MNTFFEYLESNGFFTATWLEKNEDGQWGLWPDYDGNRGYYDEPKFVVWIGDDKDLREVAKLCALVGVTRASVEYKGLVIEPNDGGHTAVQIRYSDTNPAIEQEGLFKSIGLPCGADCGKYAVIWYMGSIMGMIAAGYGKFEEWSKDHKYKCYSHFMSPGENHYESRSEQYNFGLGDSLEWKFEDEDS